MMSAVVSKLVVPDDRLVAVYVLVAVELAGKVKYGFTLDINQRIWHDTYACFSPSGKYYACAMTFQFSPEIPEKDRLWVRNEIETEIKNNTEIHSTPNLSTEWREMSVDEAVDELEVVVAECLGTIPEEIRPEVKGYYTFRPPRLLSSSSEVSYRCWNALQRWRRHIRGTCAKPKTASDTSGPASDPLLPAPLVVARPHQKECIQHLCDHFQSHDRGHVVQACGVGKTLLVLLWLYEMIPTFRSAQTDAPVFVLGVSRSNLLEQMVREFRRVFPTVHLCLVGGTPVRMKTRENIYGPTTNADSIRLWDEEHSDVIRAYIVMYPSAHRLVDAEVEATVCVVDECHHLCKRNDSTSNRTWHQFWNIPTKKTLPITATPIYTETDDSDVVGTMSEVSVFGPRISACDRSVRWAIENKCITDYDLVVVDHTISEVEDLTNAIFPSATSTPQDDRQKLLFLGAYETVNAMRRWPDRVKHVFIYTHTIEEAKQVDNYVSASRSFLSQRHPDVFSGSSVYQRALHSQMGQHVSIEDELTKFRAAPIGIISCCDLFGEGFDEPVLDAVTFATPIHSRQRIVQYALRPHRRDRTRPDKRAMVMIPTVDLDEYTPGGDTAHTSGQTVVDIVNALRTEDHAVESRLTFGLPVDSGGPSLTNQPRGSAAYSTATAVWEGNDVRLLNFRLKLLKNGNRRLGSSLRQTQTLYIRRNRELNLRSMTAYMEYAEANPDCVQDPATHFQDVWRGWTQFLGYDTRKLPKTLDEWHKACREANIRTLDEYFERVCAQTHDAPAQFPHEPVDYFKSRKIAFRGVYQELAEAHGQGTGGRRRR